MNPSVLTISLLSASTVLMIPSADAGELRSINNSSSSITRIYGGEITKTCEFPQTVFVGGCTGTLVHPRVVISAHHCGKLNAASFGEHSRSAVADKVKFSWCERSGDVRGKDAQICVLAEPMNDVPIAPIIQGCEMDQIKVGARVLLAGFGFDESDPSGPGASPGGEKRWVETGIKALKVEHELNISIGGGGKGGCNGDSGGPAFLQLDDGTWRTIGATHAGVNGGSHPKCDTGYWKSTGLLMRWYEKMLAKHNETDIDLSPCFDDDGKWAPNEHCGGYTKDVKGPFGSWGDGCGKDAPVLKYSATCGEPFAPNDDEGDESSSPEPSEEPDGSETGSDEPGGEDSEKPSEGGESATDSDSEGSNGDDQSSPDNDESEGSDDADSEMSAGDDEGSEGDLNSGSDESEQNSKNAPSDGDDEKGGCALDGESGSNGALGAAALIGLFGLRGRRTRSR